MGAVLSQVDDDGQDHPVAYYSQKLLPREQRYSTVEQECLAIKLGVQAFSVYLLGRPFRIQTDHRALQWLDKAKKMNARLTRWSLSLQPFRFTVEHRRGRANGNADALYRMEPERCFAPKKEGENVTNLQPSRSNPIFLCSQSNSLRSGQSNSQCMSSCEPLIYKKQPMPRKEPQEFT